MTSQEAVKIISLLTDIDWFFHFVVQLGTALAVIALILYPIWKWTLGGR